MIGPIGIPAIRVWLDSDACLLSTETRATLQAEMDIIEAERVDRDRRIGQAALKHYLSRAWK